MTIRHQFQAYKEGIMKLHYYAKQPNFGDSINPWFWSKNLNIDFEDESDELFVGIGTLLSHHLPTDYRLIHIMGSGTGYGKSLPNIQDNWRVHFVRGPMTATALGLPANAAITDPAVLLHELTPPQSSRDIPCGFMPHMSCDSPRMKKLVEHSGIQYISPSDDPATIIDRISRCDRLISSAMHGAILADSLRVPWYPVSTSKQNILEFKWHDWFQSMGITNELYKLPTIWPEPVSGTFHGAYAKLKESLFCWHLRRIPLKGRFILSDNRMLEDRSTQLKEAFFLFNQKYAPSSKS